MGPYLFISAFTYSYKWTWPSEQRLFFFMIFVGVHEFSSRLTTFQVSRDRTADPWIISPTLPSYTMGGTPFRNLLFIIIQKISTNKCENLPYHFWEYILNVCEHELICQQMERVAIFPNKIVKIWIRRFVIKSWQNHIHSFIYEFWKDLASFCNSYTT